MGWITGHVFSTEWDYGTLYYAGNSVHEAKYWEGKWYYWLIDLVSDSEYNVHEAKYW